MLLPPALRRSLANRRRALFESFGSDRYSRMGLNGLDRKLERHLNFDHGVFVEAGANDGVQQSNTYYFEKIRGWTGLLIEPVPELAASCRKNRHATVAEAALVATEQPGATVEIHFAGLMSTVDGALGDAAATARHVKTGLTVQPELSETRRIRVQARTLSFLIDEARLNGPIDLLSLDVEGAEATALRGLDLDRHAPRFICVESRDQSTIEAFLKPRYELREILTDYREYRDLLYARR